MSKFELIDGSITMREMFVGRIANEWKSSSSQSVCRPGVGRIGHEYPLVEEPTSRSVFLSNVAHVLY